MPDIIKHPVASVETVASAGAVLDRLPYSAHKELCRLHEFNGAPATVSDYAMRIASCMVAYMDAHDDALPKDLQSVFAHDNIGRYADDIYARAGRAETLRILNKVRSACRAVWPECSFAWIQTHKARVRALPETVTTSFRYAVPRHEVPTALEPLFAAIATATRRNIKGQVPAPLTGTYAREGTVLRFLGVLQAGGEVIDDLTIDTLVTVQRLNAYVARACAGHNANAQAQCLYRLKAALAPVGADAFTAALAQYGVVPAQLNTDYTVYVPEVERALFEASLGRRPSQRYDDEPKGLSPPVRRKVEQTLGGFHKTFASDPTLATADPLRRDLVRALDAFEAANTHWDTITLHARITEMTMASRRILYEHCRDTPDCETLTRDVQLSILSERMRDLKLAIEREAMVLPEDITPRDIRRLGLTLILFAGRRLEDLRTARQPYRPLRTLAETFRNGVIFVLFSFLVLRVGDMSRLFHGATIYRQKLWTIDIEASKNGEAITQSFPRLISRILDYYDDVIRCMISPINAANRDVFWMSRCGCALTIASFQDIVPRYTAAHLDYRIHAHLLRKIEATNALIVNPEDPESASVALRHLKTTTTRVSYQAPRAVQRASAYIGGLQHNDSALFDVQTESI